ncbi:ABC transporter permease [Demequina sp. NBRC 110053]|uniref:ABC transporter permease n=1 Tax=Demequina sp. NBRC 110053 TaxID=1570342 RepID=UPI0009FCEADD|nr:ABC transporter permease [Demequina sp. NBRC 110053]
MSAVIISEIRKVSSTRLWWILLLCMAVGVAFMTGTFAFTLAFADQLGGADAQAAPADPLATARTIYGLPVSFGYVFPVILGALMVTSEFRHRTIDTTLLLEPSRLKVIAAKTLAVVPFAVVYAVTAMVVGVGVGAGLLALAGDPTMLDATGVQRSIAMGALALVVWAIVGVGFGCAITNQVIVIVALLCWTQLVEPILRVAFAFVEPLQGVAKFLPGAAGDAMVGGSFYTATGGGDLLAPWAGMAVLLGYAVVAALIGWLVTFRRDIS